MQTIVLAAVAVAACATQVAAKPTFVALIPGASNVKGVASIGHIDPEGGGPGNAFGAAFLAAKTSWTVDLCYADSDKDGQFNGAELGDPCCEWKKGSNEKLEYTTASAPGDATSKQDPTIWAAVKCANGEDPVTKYTAFFAKAGSTSSGNATTTAAPGAKDDSASSKAAASTVTTPAPVSTTKAPAAASSGASHAAVAAASAVSVAVAAFLL